MRRRWLFVLTLTLTGLGGCEHLMPRQRPEIVKHLSTVDDNIAKAKTTLAVDGTASYAKLEPSMIAALAAAQQATDVADGRSAALKGRVAGVPAQRLARMAALCRDAIRSDIAAMRDGGVPANEADNLTAIKDGTCSLAAFGEALAHK